MDIARIQKLAAKSRIMTGTGDAYADERCKWVTDPTYASMDMWWGKDQPYYRFLYLVSKEYGGGVGIEVGTHSGIGFSCMAAGAKASNNSKSWTVGIDMANHCGAIEVPKHYQNCVFVNGKSTDPNTIDVVAKLCAKEQNAVQIMFIDATHKIDWVHAEIIAYRHLFADIVIIIMDDCVRADNNTRLPECFDGLPGQKALFPELHTNNCIGVAIMNRSEFTIWNPTIIQQNLTL